MALLLRQACQPALDNADLDSYHADLDAIQKTFKLYTPCGKYFATVSGVLFSSLRPTKAEIDFAVELLGDWLLRNQHLIADFIKEFTILDKIGKLPQKKDNMLVESTNNYSKSAGAYVHATTVTICIDELTFTFNSDGYLTILGVDDPILNWRKQVLLPLKKEKDAQAFLAEHLFRNAQQKIVDDLLAKLNTCVS